jgi:hypothetical protein
MNFIHRKALSDVDVDFFYDSIYFSKGITLLKFIVYYLFIFWMFCIRSSFEAKLALRTYYYSCDINSKIAYNTSSNFYRIIFLNRNFDCTIFLVDPFKFRLFGLVYTCDLKKEKNSLNQTKVDSFAKLEDFPFATLIKIFMILLMVS